jgi:hypothetical protein
MVMNKKGDALMNFIIVFVVVIIIGLLVVGFYKGVLGTAGAALGANDAVVVAAAGGCSTDLSVGPVDLQKKFCNDFKTIEKKSFFGLSKQLVNCEYLNSTIKTSVASIENYNEAAIKCPETTWVERCQLAINENSGSSSYSILINGKDCTKKNLILVRDILGLESWCFNTDGTACVKYAGSTEKVAVCRASSEVYLSEQDCKIAHPSTLTPAPTPTPTTVPAAP